MDFATAYAQAGGRNQRTNIKPAAFAFQGGINVMDSPSMIDPGHLLGCLNYEPGVRGGYRRFDGYERFDGQASPSDSDYLGIQVDPSFVPPVGTVINEIESGASGEVCYVDTDNSFIVLTKLLGSFLCRGSTLASLYGTTPSIGPGYLNGGLTDQTAASYYLQKYLYLQTDIGPVGGVNAQGPVRGVYPYLDKVYAFRDDAGGASASLWVSSSTGWTRVPLGYKVRFDTGVYSASMQPPDEGTVLTGATSGAQFVLQRVVTLTGTWGTDAAGFFIVSVVNGTPVAGELLKDASNVTYMTYRSYAPQVLHPGGVYEFRVHNFNAVQSPETGFRLYGVSGVDYGFEYDAVAGVFVQIETGMAQDTPDHLEVHANAYLVYSFPGGSLQNSGYQLPLIWNPVFGADERSVGEDVTFLREDVAGTLMIGTRRKIWSLSGLVTEQFQTKPFSTNSGAIARTDEMPGQLIYLEDRGVTGAQQSPAFGNFEAGTFTDKILDLLTRLIATDAPVGAVVTRRKNLYRLVFASGTVLCLSVNAQGQFGGWTQGLYPTTVNGFYGGFAKTATRQYERAFLAGANGYVYEIDKGRSFDGANVRHFLRISYFDAKSPDTIKRWRRLQVDLQPEGLASLAISVDFNFGNLAGQSNEPLDFVGNGGFWDISLWDQFTWNAARYTQAVMKVEGEGYNIGMFFAGNSNNEEPMTLYSASLQYTPRVLNRNTKG